MFSSDRLIFSQITSSDEKESLEMSQSDEVMTYITSTRLSLSDAKERFEYQLLVNKENPKIGFIKAELREDNTFIGYVKITAVQEGILEVGYAIFPIYWQKGFGTEMLKAIINYASSLSSFKTLLAIVDLENTPSIHVLTKQGFIFHKEIIKDGKKIAHYIKAIN